MRTSYVRSKPVLYSLLQSYSAVILAYGASKERNMGIQGEELLTSATDFINWYNGKLDTFQMFLQNKNFDFETLKDVSVIGNGNVATDLARVFLKDRKEFEVSDMPDPVIQIIKKPDINSVSLVARRGIYQSAFTTKEMREISKIKDVKIYLFKEDIEKSRNPGNLTFHIPF